MSTSFTGHTRERKTRRGVMWADRAARWIIATGGIGTIVAVSMVCVFLVWVVLPLLMPAKLEREATVDVAWGGRAPLHIAIDEYDQVGAALLPDGKLEIFRLDNGQSLETREFLAGQQFTASAFGIDGQQAAFGFTDGTVRLAKVGFAVEFIDPKDAPAELNKLAVGEVADYQGGLVSRTSEGQLRVQKAVDEVAPKKLDEESPIRLIDFTGGDGGYIFAILTESGKLLLQSVSERENLLTGEIVSEVETSELPLKLDADKKRPDFLLVSGRSDNVYVAWKDGRLIRFDTSDFKQPRVAEEIHLTKEGETLTALVSMLGKSTLLAGYSSGRVGAWFRIKPEGADTSDGAKLIQGHNLPGDGSPVASIHSSARKRMIMVGYENARMRVYYVTNDHLVAKGDVPGAKRLSLVAMGPKDNALVAVTDRGLARWTLDAGHPEATLKSLFLPVWYEGYQRPVNLWQSSSGSDDFEPKLGLLPLIFGTFKATFYSMVFGVPLALFAAVYTSEFLRPAVKARIKPVIEMMASLPSVVLGFLAGLIIAQFVEDSIPAVIVSFFAIPFTFLGGAYVWQMMPHRWSLRLSRWRFAPICLLLPLSLLISAWLGPLVERWLFAGDFRAWLDGREGNSLGGWMLLVLPLCALATACFVTQRVNFWMRGMGEGWTRSQWALLELGKFLAGVILTLLLAWLIGLVLELCGFDPRGRAGEIIDGRSLGLMGTYVQRNALVVGFVMGFAIIPIIYTLADDALSTVPQHLRSASLGAGATPWQTAMRIVIPTAMSGLFSAVMIGLGRAVGETMIVLMGAGNTPIMDINPFNGFQTLSALIATELPEAPQNSTHFRTLYLAALVLFGLTFLLNTLAEIIRLRFRRRAYEL